MLIRKAADIPSSEITPKADYLNRRPFMTGMAAAGVAAWAAETATAAIEATAAGSVLS